MPELWVQAFGSDVWHWCRNCSSYPAGSNVTTTTLQPSSGEFCKECLAKTEAGECDE